MLFWFLTYCVHLPLVYFFLISPFSFIINLLFLYETSELVSSYLLFLCVLQPALIPFTEE